jgi:hypothetical protein
MNASRKMNGMEVFDTIDREDLNDLINYTGKPCISAYMPTQQKGKETRQNPILYKNILEQIRTMTEIMNKEPDSGTVDLTPAISLLNRGDFWKYQNSGLALFLSPEFSKAFRLPMDVTELVTVTNLFYLKPVLPLMSYDSDFFILALSQNQCRFFKSNRQTCMEVQPDDLPAGLEETLKHDIQEKQLQFRLTAAPPAGRGGKGEVLFHGHGVLNDEKKDRILRYCQAVNKAVASYMSSGSDPLLVAAVDYLHRIYQEANTYPHLLDDGIIGNPEPLRLDELHGEAWKIIEPLTMRDMEKAVRQYHDLKGTGKTSEDISDIVREAAAGRIDRLIIPLNLCQWGSFSEESGEIELHDEKYPLDEELFNLAALHTIKNGGNVYTLRREEMPDASEVSAVFRY